jgi:hypothetical protein
MREDYWLAFLPWEHEACRVIHDCWDFMPDDDILDNEDEVFYEDGEKDDEDYVPPTAVKLEAVLPDNYD